MGLSLYLTRILVLRFLSCVFYIYVHIFLNWACLFVSIIVSLCFISGLNYKMEYLMGFQCSFLNYLYLEQSKDIQSN